MRRLLILTVLLPTFAGCFYPEPGPTVVHGEVTGYSPTASYLKVDIKTEDGLRYLNFDRRDWYVSELARRIDRNDVHLISVDGVERNLLNEILADSFRAPAEYNTLRYEAMGASASQREAYDAEYEALLEALIGVGGEAPDVSNGGLPGHMTIGPPELG